MQRLQVSLMVNFICVIEYIEYISVTLMKNINFLTYKFVTHACTCMALIAIVNEAYVTAKDVKMMHQF